MSASSHARLAAAELLRQHATRVRFSALEGPFAPVDSEAAYAIQDAFTQSLLAQRSTSFAGYKIALTTPAMREMVSFHDSVYGRLFRDQLRSSEESVVAANYGRLLIEFEIAFEIAEDVPLSHRPWSGPRILEYVKCAYPALEVADDRSADYGCLKNGILTLVADNAWNEGLVVGRPFPVLEFDALASIEGIALIDGMEVGRGTGREVLGNPADALAWLANSLSNRNGNFLRAGDLVTTGSLVKSQFPGVGQEVEFLLPMHGNVKLKIR